MIEPAEMIRHLAPDGREALELDRRLSLAPRPIDDDTRLQMWTTLGRVFEHGPDYTGLSSVGLLLGRIQSGKTTAMTGLAALGSDRGYRLVVAILGSTNLLLSQNTARLLEGLGITAAGSAYTWAHLDPTVERRNLGREVARNLASGRSVIVTVLKNSQRLKSLAEQIDRADVDAMALVLDDEADQASLNTLVAHGLQSPTYSAIATLMSSLKRHLYVQVTATPFAPLLLEGTDLLSPSFVEVLGVGPGYTGAQEFFIENEPAVVRLVGTGEALSRPPTVIPHGLRQALINFLVGSGILLANGDEAAPVSMLVHPTHRTAIHDRVATLVHRELASLRRDLERAESLRDLDTEFTQQHDDLVAFGAAVVPPDALISSLRRVLRLVKVWVVNSTADQDKVVWAASPVHVLIGGNKLDRGFTVEGLTVSYLSRTASTQADTLAQRARAFGYRGEYLPYCRFFANSATVEAFRASVLTDEAMRVELTEWMDAGHELSGWAEHVGFLLGEGLAPTRNPVAPWLVRTPARGWHVLANPDTSEASRQRNADLVQEIGLLDAPVRAFGRMTFRVLTNVPLMTIASLLRRWSMPPRSGWSRSDVVEFVGRVAEHEPELAIDVVLMEAVTGGGPRSRTWRPQLGFSNLMQGRDKDLDSDRVGYAGDRAIFKDRSGLQVHWIKAKDGSVEPLFTLALHIGADIAAATEVRRR